MLNNTEKICYDKALITENMHQNKTNQWNKTKVLSIPDFHNTYTETHNTTSSLDAVNLLVSLETRYHLLYTY